MFLPPSGRRYYSLTVITTPQVSTVDVSFDDGTTWHTALTDADPTHFFLLVRGPNGPTDDPSAIEVALDTQPLLRFDSTPEVEVYKAPYISLSTPFA